MARIDLIPIPLDVSGSQPGCLMGPDALLTIGLPENLSALGHSVRLRTPVAVGESRPVDHPNTAIQSLGEARAWIDAIHATEIDDSAITIFLGGNHLMSAGTVPLAARRAAQKDKPLFILWLDAHSDFHTLETTQSGRLHGTPVAYFTGQSGFQPSLLPPPATVVPTQIHMMGIRSVDPDERIAVVESGIKIADMRRIDEDGISSVMRRFLDAADHAGADVHVSFDVDFLDPEIAPGVGTTVPGGCTYREAHLVMEMLHDSGFVTSLDMCELNPILDNRGQTAQLAADLVSSLFGKTVIDRQTKGY